jgi:hypothetical protein
VAKFSIEIETIRKKLVEVTKSKIATKAKNSFD